MISFLKTVLIILLVYLGLKFLLKLLKPYIFSYMTKKVGKQFEKQFGANPFGAEDPKPQKEGSISIDKMPPKKEASGSTVGEYVDYEEID